MSLKAIAWAWEQPIKPASAKLVLLYLADCTNRETGACFPSIERISEHTSLDRKTIINGLSILEVIGAISARKKRGCPSHYKLHLNANLASTKSGTSTENGSTENGTRPVPKTVPNQYRKRDTNQELTRNEPKPIVAAVEKPTAATTPGARKMRGDWKPSDKLIQRAIKLDLHVANPEQVLAEFKDYWINQGTRRKDWDATFLNRLKAIHNHNKGKPHGQKTSSDIFADMLDTALDYAGPAIDENTLF